MIFHGYIYENYEQTILDIIYDLFLKKINKENPNSSEKFTKTFHMYEHEFFSSNNLCSEISIENIKNNIIPNKIKEQIIYSQLLYLPSQATANSLSSTLCSNEKTKNREPWIKFLYKIIDSFGIFLHFVSKNSLLVPAMPTSKMLKPFSSLPLDFSYEISPIPEMNEIYLSVYGGEGSDRIFEKKHVDGLFYCLPYCYVYRCILGMSKNDKITTHFTSPSPRSNFSTLRYENILFGSGDASTKNVKNVEKIKKIQLKGTTIDLYDFVAFDYNRQPHYIAPSKNYLPSQATENNTPRVIYKLHYIIYPTFLPKPIVYLYKKIHSVYNRIMRTFFVNSQNNNSWLAWVINSGNDFYYKSFFS